MSLFACDKIAGINDYAVKDAPSAAAPPAPSAKQPARQKMGGLAETPPY